MEATIQLKGCRSHSVNIKGKSFRFIFGRGMTTSDSDLVEYCESQPDRFSVFKPIKKEEKPTKKVASKQQPVEQDEDDSTTQEESPPTRGRRRKVKVEE